MSMLDNTGRGIEVGDIVTFYSPSYHVLKIGIVTRFSPKNVKVDDLTIEQGVRGETLMRENEFKSNETVRSEYMTVINEIAKDWVYIPYSDSSRI